MRMKLSSKRDIGVRLLWVLALAAVAVKLLLCSQQLFEAVPQASTIDDTLMFEMARSIRAVSYTHLCRCTFCPLPQSARRLRAQRRPFRPAPNG